MSPSERRAAEAGAVDRVDQLAGDGSDDLANGDGPNGVDDATNGDDGDGGGGGDDRNGQRVAQRPGAAAQPVRGSRASARAAGRTSDRTVQIPINDREPVEIPTIVPATVDAPAQPGPAGRVAAPAGRVEQRTVAKPTVASPRQDALDAWRSGSSTVVVPTAMGATGRVAALPAVGRRPRVRKVTRVVRHIDPWSTFKVALIFSVVLYGVLLTAGVLLWNVASNTGTVDNVERWFTQFGWETYELKGGEIFHNAWIAGLFGVIGLTGMVVLSATLFNLISDIVGGVRVTVLEEEVVERTASRADRFVVRRPPEGATPVPEFDLSGDLEGPPNPAASTPSSG